MPGTLRLLLLVLPMLWIASSACTRTRTVTQYVPVSTPVETCPVTAATLPPMPKRSPCGRSVISSDNELCYDAENAWKLAAVLDALMDEHADLVACEEAR